LARRSALIWATYLAFVVAAAIVLVSNHGEAHPKKVKAPGTADQRGQRKLIRRPVLPVVIGAVVLVPSRFTLSAPERLFMLLDADVAGR
jgi:hypothetical protein